MTPSGVWSRANRRIGLRCFRSMSGDVILLTVGLFVTVLLIARQYNDRGGSRQGRDFGELENPLREISLRLSNDQDDNGADETDAKVRSAAVRKTAPDQPRIDAVADQRSQEKVTVDPRIRRVVDSRSETCLDRQTELKFVDERVSVIVGFTDYEFYDLRNTIDSCLRLNAEDDGLVGELIVIDDGSTLDYVIDDARKYFRSIAKATLIRHDPSSTQQGNNNGERLGTANARLAGAMRAKGTVLVFLSPTVICSRGWLEPLVEAVDQHPDSIVAPHFDRIRDPISLEYQLTSDWVVGRASWDLAIRMREVPPASATGGDPKEDETNAKQPKAPQYIRTSAARGDAFAVQRQFYFDVGGYDPHLAIDAVNGGAGEQIELSIRTWMCGGVIITATCSRVGVLNLHDPVKVTDRKSAEYISALWFGDRQSIVMQTYNKLYRSHGGVDDSVPEIPKQAKRRAIQLCEKNAQKRDIDWYLSEVADDMVRPSSDAVVFGLLRVKTGRCGRLLPDTGRVLLENCRPQLYGRPSENMTFQLTRSGHLKVTGKEMASDVRQSCCGDFSRWMDLSDCFPYFL